uniref:Uncharacterized protein n=1 Tax=Sphenodon punctatus TaxID=8508 RepID=A0A8D0GWC9_SPHPU
MLNNRPTTPTMRTVSACSVFWGLRNLLTASIRMLNIRAVAKMELPKAPATSARRKPKVLFLCHLIRLNLTPTKPIIMEINAKLTTHINRIMATSPLSQQGEPPLPSPFFTPRPLPSSLFLNLRLVFFHEWSLLARS